MISGVVQQILTGASGVTSIVTASNINYIIGQEGDTIPQINHEPQTTAHNNDRLEETYDEHTYTVHSVSSSPVELYRLTNAIRAAMVSVTETDYTVDGNTISVKSIRIQTTDNSSVFVDEEQKYLYGASQTFIIWEDKL